jgi:hypothetical protein
VDYLLIAKSVTISAFENPSQLGEQKTPVVESSL